MVLAAYSFQATVSTDCVNVGHRTVPNLFFMLIYLVQEHSLANYQYWLF